MARPRNNFAIAQGDQGLHVVITPTAVRDMRPPKGPLTLRYASFLRRFCLPCRGPSNEIYLYVPDSEVYQRAPQAVKDALAPYIVADVPSWANVIDPTLNAGIDTLLGAELGDNEEPFSWDVTIA